MRLHIIIRFAERVLYSSQIDTLHIVLLRVQNFSVCDTPLQRILTIIEIYHYGIALDLENIEYNETSVLN